MIKEAEHHILAYHDPEHACNQGSIVSLDNGELLLGYNQERGPVHADSGQSCIIKSKDNGKTWDRSTQKTVWPWTDHGGNWDCAFSQISDGTILMHTRVCSFIKPTALKDNSPQSFFPSTPEKSERLKRQTGYALLRSTDNGESWEEPIPVNTSPISESGFGGYAVGGSGAGHIIELDDGGLLMPLDGTISREFSAQGGELARSFLLRSDDDGRNWEYWATIAFDGADILSFVEPGMTRLHSGKLICLMRCQVRPGRRFDNMWLVTSDDDGASWSRPVRTPLWGYPADVIQLNDGRVLAVYGYRKEPWGVRGCISEDGVKWLPENEFEIRRGGAADPDLPQYFHIGYPTVVQCKDGTLVAAYHEYTQEQSPIQCMWVTRFVV